MRLRAATLLFTLALAACSAGSLRSGGDSTAGTVSLTFLVANGDTGFKVASRRVKDVMAPNPIAIKVERADSSVFTVRGLSQTESPGGASQAADAKIPLRLRV